MRIKMLGLVVLMVVSMQGCEGRGDDTSKSSSAPMLMATATATPTSTPTLSFISKNKITVNENQIKVVKIEATGSDKFNYFIDGGDAHYFEINPSTGDIYFKAIPNKIEKSSYTFNTIAMTSNGKKLEKNMIITICDSYECRNNLPLKPFFTSPETITFKENSIQPIWIEANGQSQIDFKIEGADADYFLLNKDTGQLMFKNIPNYEDKTSYKLMVTIKDKNRDSEIQFLTIKIADIDENTVDDSKPHFVILDTVNVPKGQIYVMKLYATDENKVTFFIHGDDADAFLVDSKTGEVTFRDTPDYNDDSTYKFTAVVQDTQGNGSVKKITVNLLDVADSTPPEFVIPSTISVEEGERYVMIIVATDESDVKYSIDGEDSKSFEINRDTGYLKFIHEPDYESKSSYSFRVTATNAVGLKSTRSLTVRIIKVSNFIQVKYISEMAGFWKNIKIVFDYGGEMSLDNSYLNIQSNGEVTDYRYIEDYHCYEEIFWKIHKSNNANNANEFFYYTNKNNNYSTENFSASIENDILTTSSASNNYNKVRIKSSNFNEITSQICN